MPQLAYPAFRFWSLSVSLTNISQPFLPKNPQKFERLIPNNFFYLIITGGRKSEKMGSSVDNRIPVWLDCDPGHDVSSARVVQDGSYAQIGRDGMHEEKRETQERRRHLPLDLRCRCDASDASADASISGSAGFGSVRGQPSTALYFINSALSTCSSREVVAGAVRGDEMR